MKKLKKNVFLKIVLDGTIVINVFFLNVLLLYMYSNPT